MKAFCIVLGLMAFALCFSGCNTEPKTETSKENLHDEVQTALNRFQREDPDLKDFLDKSVAYIMYPSAGKAGFIAGGAYGRGEVFENGRMVGYSEIRQASVGLQAGAQEYSELVVFGEPLAYDKFKAGKLSFGADASAVILKAGAAKAASFRDGVVVFSEARGGAMVSLSLTGQQLTFAPVGQDNQTQTTETKTTETHTSPQ